MVYEVGQRVYHKEGGVGIVENEFGDNDNLTTDVRWLTPNNEPSVLTSLCLTENLTPVSDSVVPMPRSKQWWKEAQEFWLVLEDTIVSELNFDGE